MVASYLLDSLLHPARTRHARASAGQPEASLDCPAPAAPLFCLGYSFTTEDGDLLRDTRFMCPRALCWTLSYAGEWVYLQDPHGRYLATDRRPDAELQGGRSDGRREPVVMSDTKTDDCRWRPTVIRQDLRPAVALQNAQGLTLCNTGHEPTAPSHARQHPLLECREWSDRERFPALRQLLPWYPWRGRYRCFSRPLGAEDEVSSQAVRLRVVDTRRAETLLTAMPAAYYATLTAPSPPTCLSHVSSGAHWRLLRTTTPDVVYLRSPAGLYLTSGYVYPDDVVVLLAAKCQASRWRMRASGAGEATTVTFQHCDTEWFLRAMPHFILHHTNWVCLAAGVGRATAFALLPVGGADALS